MKFLKVKNGTSINVTHIALFRINKSYNSNFLAIVEITSGNQFVISEHSTELEAKEVIAKLSMRLEE